MVVPNVTFQVVHINSDPDEHPFGAFFAENLCSRLLGSGSNQGSVKNWRDSGWHFEVPLSDNRFQIALSAFDVSESSSRWILSVEPLDQPSVLAKIFGKNSPRYIDDSKCICNRLHDIFEAEDAISSVRWALNDDPIVSDFFDPTKLDWPNGQSI